jgi:predicted kinase
VARLIHLNGPPGVGKSTLARRYVADHPGVLNCDIDVLRTMVGGWRERFAETGALIRPAALALIAAYLEGDRDVVLPQMLASPDEIRRFEDAAVRVGADFVEVLLMDDQESMLTRFHRRGGDGPPDAWHDQVREIVRAEGGDDVLLRFHGALERIHETRPATITIRSVDGASEATYQALLRALADPTRTLPRRDTRPE